MALDVVDAELYLYEKRQKEEEKWHISIFLVWFLYTYCSCCRDVSLKFKIIEKAIRFLYMKDKVYKSSFEASIF